MLWVAQVVLALSFLFAGPFKLFAPAALLKMPLPLPVWFVRFIGACETLGAIGLILPGLLRVRPGLTPLAARGLLIIMMGATVVGILGRQAPAAVTSGVLGVLSALVAYGRAKWAPIAPRSAVLS